MKYFFERFSFQHIGKIPMVLLALVLPLKAFTQNNCDDFIYGQSKDQTSLRLHPREEPGADAPFLDRWFRGPTDYAVIAWKDGRGATR